MIESKHSLMEKENLYEIIHNLPVNFDKSWEGYKDMPNIGKNSKLPGFYS